MQSVKMKLGFLLLAAAATGLGLPAAAAPAPKRVSAAQDWTRTVVQTPEGGFRMGNPNAPVKLVEYGSLTCDHCAAFAKTAMAALTRDYVRTGKVSFEFRNFVLNGIDASASLLARCGGTRNFFKITEAMFATQDQWVQKVNTMTDAEREQLKALPIGELLGRIADRGGLTQLGAQHGLPAAEGKKCLADETALARLDQIYGAAEALGVAGTPTFFINGSRADAHDWPTLETLIRKAAG